MQLTIRDARRDDLAALCRLVNQMSGHEISPEQMNDRLTFVERSPIDSLYVCEQEGVVVGVLGFRIRENLEEVSQYGEISLIAVEERARRRGIGRFMMEHAEKLAAREGCKGTWLVSGIGREEQAHRFYEKLGYRVTGYRFIKARKR